MKLFGIKTKKIRAETTAYNLNSLSTLLSSLGIDSASAGDALSETTYFICLKTLSEIMGKLDIKKYTIDGTKGKERVYDNTLNYLLNIEPNPYYTATTLKQAVEMNRNHYGNAYVYMERYRAGRNAGQLKYLWLLPSAEVTIWMDDRGLFGIPNALWYVWNDSKTGIQYRFNMNDILHFKTSSTFDGIVGKSVRQILSEQIETAKYGQQYLEKLYKGNMQSSKVILYYTGELDPGAETALVKTVEGYASTSATGAFIPLPQGITATPLDSKLVDAEFSTIRQANALSIAAAFGVSPNFVNDYSKSSYSNSVTQQQALYTNTMMPIFKTYSEEYTRKMLTAKEKQNTVLEVDPKALFKLNPVEQMGVLQQGLNNLMYTPNEAREELGLPYVDNPKANELVGNGNIINLDNVGKQYGKGGEN